MISHTVTFSVPLTSFGGLQGMAEKARKIRDSFDGKSSAHWQAWENLAAAIDRIVTDARARELNGQLDSIDKPLTKSTIKGVLEAAHYAGWTSPYEREGAMGEHVERVAERLESKGYVIK